MLAKLRGEPILSWLASNLKTLKIRQHEKGVFSQLPEEFRLSQNYPNPSNSERIIQFFIP